MSRFGGNEVDFWLRLLQLQSHEIERRPSGGRAYLLGLQFLVIGTGQSRQMTVFKTLLQTLQLASDLEDLLHVRLHAC